jgi:hypothetical protein
MSNFNEEAVALVASTPSTSKRSRDSPQKERSTAEKVRMFGGRNAPDASFCMRFAFVISRADFEMF